MEPDSAEARRARERLEVERARVEELIAGLRRELGDEPESEQLGKGAYDQHPADLGSETFEREKDLSILESLESEVAELEEALRRIDAGRYGIDEVTGEPIAPERLDAIPSARRNVEDSPRR